MIVTNLFVSYRPDQANSKTKLYDIPQGYVWNQESSFLFSKALGSTDLKNKINVFLKSVPSDDVDDTKKRFCKTMNLKHGYQFRWGALKVSSQ